MLTNTFLCEGVDLAVLNLRTKNQNQRCSFLSQVKLEGNLREDRHLFKYS